VAQRSERGMQVHRPPWPPGTSQFRHEHESAPSLPRSPAKYVDSPSQPPIRPERPPWPIRRRGPRRETVAQSWKRCGERRRRASAGGI
jgi:hypothetical protein